MKSVGNTENRRLRVVQTKEEKRKHLRSKCERVTFFATRECLYEGHVKNISLGGVFIESKDAFDAGEKITVAIPCQSNPDGVKLKEPFADDEVKMKGVVVWKESGGFGLQFVRPG